MKQPNLPSNFYLRAFIIGISFLLIFLMIYSPVLSFDYLRHDDMQLFMWDHHSYKTQRTFYVSLLQTIRPIAQFHITTWQFFIHKMADGKFVRFFTICWFALDATLFFTVLRQLSYPRLFSFITPILIFTLSPFYIVAATVEYQHHLLAIFFVLSGFLLFLRNPNYLIFFFLLFGCALLTYPPASMIITTLILAQAFSPNTSNNTKIITAFTPALKLLTVTAIAMLGYFILGKLIYHFFWHAPAQNTPYEFTAELNLITTLHRTLIALGNAFNFSFVPFVQLHSLLLPWLIAVSCTIASLGLLSYFARTKASAQMIISKLGLILILILLAPASTTLAGAWHGSHRTLEGLMSLLLFLVLWSLYELFHRANLRFKFENHSILVYGGWFSAAVLIAVTGIYSHWFINKYFIEPERAELNYIRGILSEILPKEKELHRPIIVHMILAKRTTLIANNPIAGDEFGTLTSYHDYYWGLPLMVAMLREQGLDTPPPYIWGKNIVKTPWGQFSISNPGEKLPYTLRQLHDVILINMNKAPETT